LFFKTRLFPLFSTTTLFSKILILFSVPFLACVSLSDLLFLYKSFHSSCIDGQSMRELLTWIDERKATRMKHENEREGTMS
jgi:hypothetical protein